MNPGVITALATGIPAIIGAVVALIRQLQHNNDPAAHGGQAAPSLPAGPAARQP